MICPLKFNSNTLNVDGVKNCSTYRDVCKCEKKECEWWIELTKQCVVAEIATSLYGIERDGVGNA